MEMGGITFGAEFHERRMHVLVDGAAHFEREIRDQLLSRCADFGVEDGCAQLDELS